MIKQKRIRLLMIFVIIMVQMLYSSVLSASENSDYVLKETFDTSSADIEFTNYIEGELVRNDDGDGVLKLVNTGSGADVEDRGYFFSPRSFNVSR